LKVLRLWGWPLVEPAWRGAAAETRGLFANINYEVVGIGVTNIILKTGRNSFGPINDPLTVYFAGNPTTPDSQLPGGVSGAAKAIFALIPEPSALALGMITFIGYFGCNHRNRQRSFTATGARRFR
jgi:hypothetical protein